MICEAHRTSHLALRIHLGLRHQSDLRRGPDPTGRWTDVVHRLDGEELRAWLASCRRYHRLCVMFRGQSRVAGVPVTSTGTNTYTRTIQLSIAGISRFTRMTFVTVTPIFEITAKLTQNLPCKRQRVYI